MEVSTLVASSIVIPGPELRQRVDKFAANLSVYDKTKADEMVAKVLASNKRNMFLFVDPSHIFYQYFLSKLTEFRNHPELRPAKEKKSKNDGDSTTTTNNNVSSSSSSSTTNIITTKNSSGGSTTKMMKDGHLIRTSGGSDKDAEAEAAREKLLAELEMEARRYLTDPFPSQYNLDTKGGTIEMSALMMDLMTCTAQYVAKYGKTFLHTVVSKQRHNPLFRFLHDEDIRHDMFNQLVRAYDKILHFDVDETETRLEKLTSSEYVLNTICSEKTKYANATLARRKAALLTDDELRAKLQWNSFKILHSFTLSDLALDGPLPVERPTKVARVEGKVKESTSSSNSIVKHFDQNSGSTTQAEAMHNASQMSTSLLPQAAAKHEIASIVKSKVESVVETTKSNPQQPYMTVDLTAKKNEQEH